MAVQLNSKNSDEAVEQVELFSIDGQSYYIPKKIKANLQLKYLKVLREEGELPATYVLLEGVLTPEGYQALMDYDDLSEDDLDNIMEIAQKIALGDLEEDDGEVAKTDGS